MIEIGKEIIARGESMFIVEVDTFQDAQGFTCGSVWAMDQDGEELEIMVDDIDSIL
jgi:hypothetical protein